MRQIKRNAYQQIATKHICLMLEQKNASVLHKNLKRLIISADNVRRKKSTTVKIKNVRIAQKDRMLVKTLVHVIYQIKYFQK